MRKTLVLSALAPSILSLAACAGEEFYNPFTGELPEGSIFQQVRVDVDGEGDGSGMVVASDPSVGINCAITTGQEATINCDSTFDDAGGGGVFTLTATPSAGSVFVGWGGDCAGAVPVCQLSFSEGPNVRFDVIAAFYVEEGSGEGSDG